jgi:cell division protein FtsB
MRTPALPTKRAVSREDAVEVHAAAARTRRRHPAAQRLSSTWPGQRPSSVPPGFPGREPGGNVVFTKEPEPALRAVIDEPVSAPHLPRKRRTTSDERQRDAKRRRPSPIRPPQRFNDIVAAVYAALADPLAADSAEAREQRAARVREIGLVAASTALVAVLVYGIFPVRTFLNQRSNTAEAEERLEKLSEANERLEHEADQLRDDDEIEMRARSDYNWVFPGEESYGVLPPPVAPTTTTTTEP